MKISIARLKQLIKEQVEEVRGSQFKHRYGAYHTTSWQGGDSLLGVISASSPEEAEKIAAEKFGRAFTGNYGKVRPISAKEVAKFKHMLESQVVEAEKDLESCRKFLADSGL